jgi:homogentisate 1,2-dioxygenase
MYQKGRVPGRGEETELTVHAWTRRGFFGDYATLYKTHNPGNALRWDAGLGPAAIDVNKAKPSDAERADGRPLPLVTNGDITVSVSKRRETAPYCWRNADADELYFIDRGRCRFETELGRLEAGASDMVYLPRNMIYRLVPLTGDNQFLILETKSFLETAERYHRDHGEINAGLDMSLIEVPEPWENTSPSDTVYEVRTKVNGELLAATFDFDPVGVTVGWAGDPLVFRLSAWDVPSAGLPSTPPTAAVFMTDDKEAVVTVHTPRRGPDGGGGPPAHTNDWDELWFLHSAEPGAARGPLGLLRWEPQGATQPGFKFPRGGNGSGPQPPAAPVVNFNIDVHYRLHITPEAKPYVVDHAAMSMAPA